MIASLLASALLFFGLLTSTRRELIYRGANILRADIRLLVPFGITLMATNALSTVVYQADVVVVSLLVRDPLIIGGAGLALLLPPFLLIPPGSSSATTYPRISPYTAA